MKLFQKIAGMFTKKTLTSSDFNHFFRLQNRGSDVSNANSIWGTFSKSEQEGGYANHAIVFACIWKLMISFLEAPIMTGTETDKGWEEQPTDELALLKNPSLALSPFEFWSYHIAHMDLTGASFMWLWRDKGTKTIREMWPIPTSWVSVAPLMQTVEGDDRRFISHYVITIPNSSYQTRVEHNDMVFCRFVDPSSFTGYSGPFQAAYKDYKTDVEREDYIVEMLDNNRVPGLILKQEMDWTDQQKIDMREVLKDKLGKGKRGSPLLLSGIGAGIEIPTPLKDLDWPGLAGMSESRICAAFGIPPIIVGARVGLEHATYSNYAVAEKIFYRGTMTGIWMATAAALTTGLYRTEGNDETEVRFNLTKVRSLREDQTEEAKRARELHEGGIASFYEAQEIAGISIDDAQENYYLHKIGFERVPVGAPLPSPLPPEEEPEEKHFTDWESSDG